MQTFTDTQTGQYGLGVVCATRRELAAWPQLQRLVVTRRVAQQFASAECFKTDRANPLRLGQRQNLIDIAIIDKWPDGEQRNITQASRNCCVQDIRIMRRNPAKSSLPGLNTGGELV